MSLDVFKDILPSILVNKEDVLTEENVGDYNSYIINRALSNHIDTVLYANEINFYNRLDKPLQYHYLLNSIKGKKRPFQKWFKYAENENIQLVKEYFGYSNEKAKDALKILSADDLTYIKNMVNKGGMMK